MEADDHAERLAARYNRHASAYRELWAPVLAIPGRRLLRELAGARAGRIVDVGTGVGTILPELRRVFPDAFVLGVDRSPGMLALAPVDIPRAVMDSRRLALSSGSMDVVILLFVIFHLPNPLDGLVEARRVLRPGGRVGTLTWGGNLESKATRIWTECLDAHGAAPPDRDLELRDEQVNTPQKMGSLMREAGFKSVRTWEDELVISIDIERFIRMKTSLGSEKPRFDSLDAAAQETCVGAARRRMEVLAPEDWVARGKIIFALAGATPSPG